MTLVPGRRGPGPLLPVLAAAALLPAAGPSRPVQAPRYTGALLACAVFDEQVRTAITSASGGATASDRAGRDGTLVLRAADSAGVLVVEAWYDSLAVWRDTGAGTERADPDGFVGGRYRGRLHPDGRYEPGARPFVPDALAALADLSVALDDFLPPLPPEPLDRRRAWTGLGLEIRRLEDGRLGGVPVERYRWTRASRRDQPVAANDSVAVAVQEESGEESELSWSPAHGPLAWHRKIRVRARVPARPGVIRAMTSTVEQEVWVTRRYGHPACAGAREEER